MALSGMGDGGHGGRKSVDSEINMVPMIDLLICCIAFLMLTATWATMARMATTSQAPSNQGELKTTPQRTLHVEARGGDFRLVWKDDGAVVKTVEVPRRPVDAGKGSVKYPDLAHAAQAEWASLDAEGAPSRPVLAVVHCDHHAPFREMAGVMDALMTPQRGYPGLPRPMPAFEVTLSQD